MDVLSKRERCHMCLLSACVGMIQGPCPIAEEQVKGRGCGEEQMLERINYEVMCFLLHSRTHTHYSSHSSHQRGLYNLQSFDQKSYFKFESI